MDNKIIDINRKHPEWQKMYARWAFYKDSYKGGEAYVKPASQVDESTGLGSYLFKHDFEHLKAGKFLQRHIRSYYPNYCRLPINTFVKYIFSGKAEINREYGEDYEPYINSIDMRDTYIDNFMKMVATNMLVYGNVYIIVDKKPVPDTIINLDQQITAGIYRAYANMITPENVVDWSVNPLTGRYNWVLIRTETWDDDDYSAVRQRIYKYTLWTETEIYLLDQYGELEETNEKTLPKNPLTNGLEEVPIVNCIYTDVDDDKTPESMLADIAMINREIYNAYSLYQEELYKCAFAQLLMPKSKDDFTEMDEIKSAQYLSQAMVLDYTEGATAPSWLTPPVQALVEKRAYINDLIMKILQMSNLQKQDGIEGQAHLSGLAMAFSYNDTWYTVAQLSSRIQLYEEKMWALIKAYDGNNGTGLIKSDIKIEYPTEFDVLTDEASLLIYDKIKQNLTASPTIQVMADMDLVSMRYKHLPDDKLDQIERELEEEYEVQKQDQAADKEAVNLMNTGIIENEAASETATVVGAKGSNPQTPIT